MQLAAYPNPTSEPVTLDVWLGTPTEVRVNVFDVLGREVWGHTARLGAGSHTLRPEVPWRPGLYLVRLRAGTGEVATTKLLYLGR